LIVSLVRKEETVSAILDFILALFYGVLIPARFSFLPQTFSVSIRSKRFEQQPFTLEARHPIYSHLCVTTVFHNILHSTDHHHHSAAAIVLIPSILHYLLPFLTAGIRLQVCARFLTHCDSSPSTAFTLVFVQTVSLR
jgi:hypothetical protein